MRERPREARVELLLGRLVHDSQGRRVGRIEEIRADWQEGECVVREYLLGTGALLERLSAWAVGRFLVTLVGLSARDLIHVDWDELDVTGGAEPRLTRPVESLRHGQTGSRRGRRPKREARSARRRAS